MGRHLAWWLEAFRAESGRVAQIRLAPPEEIQSLALLNATATQPLGFSSIHDAVAAQVARTAGQRAVVQHGQSISYGELEQRATALAGRLRAAGFRPGDIVGLCLERTPDLVVAMLAILKAGAAYLPLDPDYPRDRIAFMIADSGTRRVVATSALAGALGLASDMAFLIDGPQPEASPVDAILPAVAPDQPAYMIYTSGSTGRPKGVVVTHASVLNFFAGMSQRVPHEPPGRWLAVTSLSFDISVLELCWTLTRGFTVVLDANTAPLARAAPAFSLFYFASDSNSAPADRYKLLLEGAKFADREGFCAIWTPERHFHAFGGLYPNPALTSAAIAAITTRLQIRAGSCVLPLHHPIRVAEEWSFVDNISQGRVGVSFAAGWQPNDFAIAPAAFADRKNAMLDNIEVVRRLWRGESVEFPGPLGKPVAVQTLPRPIQKELPIWLTAAGNPETFQQAGTLGCHLLTHLLGQTIEDVAGKIALYRQAWRQAGHPGDGHVTLMLHTFVGPDEDAVRESVRAPMKEYLRSSVDLIRQAAWSFPTFVQRGAADGRTAVEIMESAPLSAQEMDALLEHAFVRYYGTSGLFGTPQRCITMVDRLSEAGVDEIACLIDFGIATDTVLAHLHHLKELMDACGRQRFAPRRAGVADEIARHGITHLQCTPSMAAMLVADAAGRAALSQLQVLLVGGEALPPALARQLRALVPGTLLNMYGPTETTVWSTACELGTIGEFVPLGQPIANTRLSIRSAWDAEC
ncbi:MAG: MupA/Atu3671 family FMN-dependent luciferase-like monooxygenase, partial [Ramlibacter sp.]